MAENYDEIANGDAATPSLFNDRFDAIWKGDSLNAKRYGATGDGVTDDTDAIADMLQAAIDYSKTIAAGQGVVVRFPPGYYKVGNLPWFSLSSNTRTYDSTGVDTTKLTDYCRGNVIFYARGAVFEHTGNGSLFKFWGTTGSNRRIQWYGGQFDGSATQTEAFFKIRDGNKFGLHPHRMGAAIRHFLFQNWLNWTENAEVSGIDGPLDISGADVSIECQSGNQASKHDYGSTGQEGNAGEASYARLRVENLQNGGRIYTVWARANTYDGWMGRWSGNASTLQAHFKQDANATKTLLEGVHHEQGDAEDAWASSTTYTANQRVSGNVTNFSPPGLLVHSLDSILLDVRMQYSATSAGVSGGTEPAWNSANTSGLTIADGSIIWTNQGLAAGYVVDAYGATGNFQQLIRANDLVWGGSFALTRGLDGHNAAVNHYHPIQAGAFFTVATSLSVPSASSSVVLSVNSYDSNEIWEFWGKSEDNSVRVKAELMTGSGGGGVVHSIYSNSGYFGLDSSNNLRFANTSGADKTIYLRGRRVGPEGTLL
jgi:hypothetical protein